MTKIRLLILSILLTALPYSVLAESLKVGETKTLYAPSSPNSIKWPYLSSYTNWRTSGPIEKIAGGSSTDSYCTIRAKGEGSASVTCDAVYWDPKGDIFDGRSPTVSKTWNFDCYGDEGGGGSDPGPDQIQLEIGQKYQCLLDDYADNNYSILNISWEVSSGLTVNSSDIKVRTVSFSEYKSGTYSVTANWIETLLYDNNDPIRQKSHIWIFTCKQPSDIKVTSISLSPSTMNIEVGESQYINKTVSPSNATNQSVSWSSSNTGVASVSNSGQVKAVSAGTATITCKANDGSGVTATCKVIVTKPNTVAEINTTNFPDASFRSWLLSQSYGTDGELTEGEISKITSIDVSGNYSESGNIKSLKGIEYFTALKYLYCSYNQLTTLDISKNTALTSLSCNNNKLTTLDVSKQTALTYLSCCNNKLTRLDVSKLTALKDLICDGNQLTILDVSKNTALTDLSCDGNQLTSLDVSKNISLKHLYCKENKLTALDVSKNMALIDLRCSSNQLSALDVSKNTALTDLSCDGNQLTSLDVSKNTSLTLLSCYSNQIRGSAMDRLVNSLNSLTGKNKEFFVIGMGSFDGNICTKSQVAVAKSKGWTVRKQGWDIYEGSDDTPTEKITLTANPSGGNVSSGTKVYLTASSNSSTVSGANIYYTLNGSTPTTSSTKYTSSGITITQSCTLKAIAYKDGYETSSVLTVSYTVNSTTSGIAINATNFPDDNFCNYLLSQSYGTDGKLTEDEIKGITRIDLYDENISSLKGIEHFTALTSLNCTSNQLTTLDISKNTALTELSCGFNKLTTLDISKNTALTILYSPDNQLTSLDVSKNANLEMLICYSNNIKEAEMEKLVNSLPSLSSDSWGPFIPISLHGEEKNICTKSQVAKAKAKGWTVYDSDWHDYEGSEDVVTPQTINMSSAGYATFYSSESAYTLPSGLSAQVVTGASNSKLTYKTIADGSVAGVVPKSTAVMLVSDSKRAGSFTLTPSESTTTYSGTNLLRGSDEATTTTGDGYHYKLSYGKAGSALSSVFGWYWGSANGGAFQIDGHKAWLVIPKSSAARGYSIEGETLGVGSISFEGEADDVYYDLQGRRVSKPTAKGVYIKNGKKVTIK